MTRELKIHVASVTALLLAVGIAVGLKNDWLLRRSPKSPAGPQDTIYGMLDAARTGNVGAYLGSYAGALQASLLEAVRESTTLAMRHRELVAPSVLLAEAREYYVDNTGLRQVLSLIAEQT